MKRNLRQRVSLAFLIFLPLALFFVARQAASWRPRLVSALPGHDAFAISPDERSIAYWEAVSRVIATHDLHDSKRIVQHASFPYSVEHLNFSPDGRHVAIGWALIAAPKPDSANDTKRIGVSLLGLDDSYREFQIDKDDFTFDRVAQVRFSPDGSNLWMASTDNLRAWDIPSGKLKHQWYKSEGRDSSLPFFSVLSMDCRLNFRSDSDGYSVWDVPNEKLLLRTKLPHLADSDLIFSADSTLASYYAPTPDVYYVIETRTARRLWQTTGDSDVAFSHDKAISRSGKYYMVREARTGKLLYRLPANPDYSVQPIESRFWLYVRDKNSRLLRQRLDEPPFYLRPLLLR